MRDESALHVTVNRLYVNPQERSEFFGREYEARCNPAPSVGQKCSSWSWAHHGRDPEAAAFAAPTAVMAGSVAYPLPGRNFAGGSMPTVHYPSWEQLGRNLSEVGIDGGVLQDTKENLDSKGSHTITEVILSDEQVGQLGFTDVAA